MQFRAKPVAVRYYLDSPFNNRLSAAFKIEKFIKIGKIPMNLTDFYGFI